MTEVADLTVEEVHIEALEASLESWYVIRTQRKEAWDEAIRAERTADHAYQNANETCRRMQRAVAALEGTFR